jgi:hypothetical protein
MPFLVFLVLIAAVAGTSAAQTEQDASRVAYVTYHNTEGGNALIYPEGQLIPTGENVSETERHFVSPDGRVSLRTFAYPVIGGDTLTDLYHRVSTPTAERTVTYQTLRDDWFVVSGFDNGDVYYQRTLLDDGLLKGFRIRYPAELKPEFDPITSRISWSFRALNTTNAQTGPSQQRTELSPASVVHALIHISVTTNGVHVWEPPGPEITVGDPVLWAYIVVNMGSVDLNNVTVTDDQGVNITCPAHRLSVGSAMICVAQGTAERGYYTNRVSVRAEAPGGEPVTHELTSHYVGIEPTSPLMPTAP